MIQGRIIFLCTANACRSQMAEGFARTMAPDGVEVFSAGTEPGPEVNPLAVQVMADAGVDISAQSPKSIDSLPVRQFDLMITLCDAAREACPVLPGAPGRIAWTQPDPAGAQGDEEQRLTAFRQVRDNIRRLCEDLFQRGYLNTLLSMKRNFNAVLDNLGIGVLMHDMTRHILFFNAAAEEITGYDARNVIGGDCHSVFPNGFCGGKCHFDDDSCTPDFETMQYPLDITDRRGETKHLQMRVIALKDDTGQAMGVMASFRDMTHEMHLEERLHEVQQFAGIIGRDHSMQHVYKTIRDVAGSHVPVLILGETGTGKELVASAIHNESPRAGKLFVPVNCGALPEGIIESELFGHVRGAFTGAVRDKKGRFEMADGGTIFLDEIGDLPQPLQVKLLRVLQEGVFERVGGEETIRVDVRVISATNQDLQQLMSQGRFREDLYYRLAVAPLSMPPLRERRNDIPLLARHFIEKSTQRHQRDRVNLSPDCLNVLLDYNWPGNVRQLQNAIEFALMKCREDVIEPMHLPPEIFDSRKVTRGRAGRKISLTPEAVRGAMEQAGGNKAKAARLLGVARATLYRYLKDIEK